MRPCAIERREDDEAIADIEANHALSETDSMNLGELSRVPIQRSFGGIELRPSLASNRIARIYVDHASCGNKSGNVKTSFYGLKSSLHR